METRHINLTEAKAELAAVIDRVIAGEEIVITRRGEPVVKLSKIAPVKATPEKKKSLLGLFEGQGWIAPDFNEWPEEEARALGIID